MCRSERLPTSRDTPTLRSITILGKTIIYALHGLLALFFSDNGLTQEELFNDLDQLIEYQLKRRDPQ